MSHYFSQVNVTHGSHCPDTCETTVVYAALNIPRDSVKSRNEVNNANQEPSVVCIHSCLVNCYMITI